MNRIITLALTAATLMAVAPDAGARLTLAEARAKGRVASPYLKRAGKATEARTAPVAKGSTPMRAPAKRLSPQGSDIYGYLGYADTYDFKAAMCSLEGKQFIPIWEDEVYQTEDEATMNTGWAIGDRLCGITAISTVGFEVARFNVEYDLISGRVLTLAEIPEGTRSFDIACLDKSDNRLYGIYKEGTKYCWGSAPVDAPNDITFIKEANRHMYIVSLTYREDDQTIYGVNVEAEMIKISHEGEPELLTKFDLPNDFAAYYTGLLYSQPDGIFYWNANYDDYSSDLFTINPEDYSLTMLDECINSEQYMFFVSHDGLYDPQAPERPEVGEISFPDGLSSGTVEFSLPTQLQDGTPIRSALRYSIFVDNALYGEGTAEAGKRSLTYSFEGLTSGFHSFGITVSADGHTSPAAYASAFVGQDTPLPPEDVELSETELTWKAVTAGVNGGYVDASAMNYHIFLRGEEIGETKDTRFAVSLPADQPVDAYYMSVCAEYDNIWSEQAWSNPIVYGMPLEMPVDIVPTRQQAALFSFTDSNEDYSSWNYDSGEASFKYISGGAASDDWLVTPPIQFESAEKYYTLTFDARGISSRADSEELSVYIGPSEDPDTMVPVGDIFTPTSRFSTVQRLLKTDAPGAYHIGFRCTSPAGMAGVSIKNISIKDGGVVPSSPSMPTAVSATAGAKGELKARVDFTFPTADVSGRTLDSDVRLRAVVAGDSKAVVNGKPGEKAYATVNTHQGDNTLTVTVSLDGNNSPEAYVQVYTGVTLPAAVSQLNYLPSDDMMSVTLGWPAVTKGVDNGYIEPDQVTYNVYRQTTNSFLTQWVFIDTDLKETTFNYELEPGEPQALMRFGVAPVNAAGVNTEITSAAMLLGTPYTLPMTDNFAEAGEEGAAYSPYINYRPGADYKASFEFVTPEELGSEFADESGFYFVAAGNNGDKARLGMPCFSTKGTGARITVTALCGNGFSPISIYADCIDFRAPRLIGTMPSEGGLVSKEFYLPEDCRNRGWVQIFFDGTITDSDMLALRGYSVDAVDAVEEIGAADVTVTSGKGFITVTGAEGNSISVFSADGRLAASATQAPAEIRFALESGIYLVKTGGKTVKTIVR